MSELKSQLRGKASSEIEGSSSDDSNSEIREEFEDAPTVRVSPESLVVFDLADVFFTGNIKADQNLNDFGNPDAGQFGFNVRNPIVPVGTIVEIDEGSQDYKIIDVDAENVQDNGDTVTISTGQSGLTTGTKVDGLPGVATFYFSGSVASREIARTLDKNGNPFAQYYEGDDGEVINNSGLLEYHPDHDVADDNVPDPRVARYPVPREDVDEGVAVYLTHRELIDPEYEGNMYWSLMFRNDFEGDDIGEATSLDRLGGNHEELEYGSHMKWHDGDDASGKDVQVSSDNISKKSTDKSTTGLSEDAQQVVKGTINYLENEGLSSSQIEVVSHVEDNLDNPDEETVAKVVDKIKEKSP